MDVFHIKTHGEQKIYGQACPAKGYIAANTLEEAIAKFRTSLPDLKIAIHSVECVAYDILL